jgi:hypothetical protein
MLVVKTIPEDLRARWLPVNEFIDRLSRYRPAPWLIEENPTGARVHAITAEIAAAHDAGPGVLTHMDADRLLLRQRKTGARPGHSRVPTQMFDEPLEQLRPAANHPEKSRALVNTVSPRNFERFGSELLEAGPM